MNFFGERESLREYQWHTRLTYAIGQQYDLLIDNHWTLLIWLFTQLAVFAVVYLAYRIVLVFGIQDNKDKTIEERKVSLLREATSPVACKVVSTELKNKEVESKNDFSFLLEKLVDKIGFRKEKMHKSETFKPGIHDADNWLRFDFERTAQVNNWSKRDKIKMVKLFLTDKVIYELITFDLIVRDDWDHFVN